MGSAMLLLVALATSSDRPVAEPFEVRFAEKCIISGATWAGDHLRLLVRSKRSTDVRMAVYVDRSHLYNWSGPLDLSNPCGLGTGREGELITVLEQSVPGRDASRLRFRGSQGGGKPWHRDLGTIHAKRGEWRVWFLPSRPGTFITPWRVGHIRRSRAETGTQLVLAPPPQGLIPPVDSPRHLR